MKKDKMNLEQRSKVSLRKRKSLTRRIMYYLIPTAVGLIFFIWIALPMAMAFLWSFVNPDYPWSYPQPLPTNLSWYHWNYIFTYTNILGAIKNSFFIAAATICTSATLALPTAYAIGRRPIKGKEFYKILMLFPVAFPGMAMALFLGRMLFMWGFSGTYIGVIIGHTLISLPYMLRIMTVNFEGLPQELVDAAHNLGAKGFQTFLEVYLPMVLPGLLAGAIFVFITSMEEFTLTFIIGAPNISTIPTILYSYLGYNFTRTSASVVSLILVIPNIILLIITERFVKTEYMGAALGKM